MKWYILDVYNDKQLVKNDLIDCYSLYPLVMSNKLQFYNFFVKSISFDVNLKQKLAYPMLCFDFSKLRDVYCSEANSEMPFKVIIANNFTKLKKLNFTNFKNINTKIKTLNFAEQLISEKIVEQRISSVSNILQFENKLKLKKFNLKINIKEELNTFGYNVLKKIGEEKNEESPVPTLLEMINIIFNCLNNFKKNNSLLVESVCLINIKEDRIITVQMPKEPYFIEKFVDFEGNLEKFINCKELERLNDNNIYFKNNRFEELNFW